MAANHKWKVKEAKRQRAKKGEVANIILTRKLPMLPGDEGPVDEQRIIRHYRSSFKGVPQTDKEWMDNIKREVAVLLEDLNKEEETLKQRKSELEQSIENFENTEIDRKAVLKACEIVRDNVKTLTYEKKRFALEALKVKVSIDGDVITVGGSVGIGNIEFTPAGWCHPRWCHSARWSRWWWHPSA